MYSIALIPKRQSTGGANVSKRTTIPDAPAVIFSDERLKYTASYASESDEPTIGMNEPAANFTPFLSTPSESEEKALPTVKKSEQTKPHAVSIKTHVFLTMDDISESSVFSFTVFATVIPNIAHIRGKSTPDSTDCIAKSITESVEKESCAVPMFPLSP